MASDKRAKRSREPWHVGLRFAAWRRAARMKEGPAAKKLGWSLSKLVDVERGARLPDLRDLWRMAIVYRVPVPTEDGAMDSPYWREV